MEVFGKYSTTATANPYDFAANLVGNLLNQLPLTPAELQAAGLQSSISNDFATMGRSGLSNADGVSAYLNYILLDETFTFVSAGYQMLPDDADASHQQLAMELIPEQDGYVYIYLTNESQQLTDVYFDDFKVTHEVLIKELQLEAYRYGFNGKEKDSKGEFGLNHYDYGFRIYNPSIAKFLSVDPLTASYPWYTPYQFAGNKPIQSVDLDGLEEADYRLLTLPNGRKMAVNVNDEKSLENFHSEVVRINIQMGVKVEQEHFYKNLSVRKHSSNVEISKAIEKYWDSYWDKLANLGDRVVRFMPISGSLLDLQDAQLDAKMGTGSNTQQAAAFGWFVFDLATLGVGGGGKGKIAKEVTEETVTLYRAVGMSELADIFESRLIRPGEGGYINKLFAETFDDALAHGIKRGEDFAVIAVDVAKETVDKLYKSNNVDLTITQGRYTYSVYFEMIEEFNQGIKQFLTTPALKNTDEGVKVIK